MVFDATSPRPKAPVDCRVRPDADRLARRRSSALNSFSLTPPSLAAFFVVDASAPAQRPLARIRAHARARPAGCAQPRPAIEGLKTQERTTQTLA